MPLILLTIILSGTVLSGFTFQPGIGSICCETKSEIFNMATYHEQIAAHGVNGVERAYFVEVNTQDADLRPYVFEGEVTGTYTMDHMINDLTEQGYRIIAGINGDVYDMSSGAPKGLTIHDGKIITSGYNPEYVISFDKKGVASLEKVDLKYTLKGTILAPEPIMMPSIVPDLPAEPEDTQQTLNTSVNTDPHKGARYETEPELNLEENLDPPARPEPEQQISNTPVEYQADISYFNVPYGETGALHLFNRHYAPSTKTQESSVEVILDKSSSENAELTVGSTITATVAEIRKGSFNSPIGDDQLLLSTRADSAHALELAQLIPGSTVEITVQERNGNLSHSQEALGIYHVLYDKGQYVSGGTNPNPRTLLGIKADGNLLLYVLDGRQPDYSEGLGLTDAAKHLVDLGCKTVVNMDGGGSSVIAVREGGIDAQAVVKNSPSGKIQRKTTNGLLLVYDKPGKNEAKHLHTYLSQPLAMPGADIQLTTYASNDKYEPVSLRKDVEYSIASGSDHQVDENGLFTAGNTTGPAEITVRSGSLRATAVVSIEDRISFEPQVKDLALEPGEGFDIDIKAKFGYAPIASKDSLFAWSCDPNLGTIDANGFFQAAEGPGRSGQIYVEYNGLVKSIPVQLAATAWPTPEKISFADIQTHWAKAYIEELATQDIVHGMGDDRYLPDDFLTRAQFLTMLANTIYGLNITQTVPAGFTDVPAQEWFYNYVNWAYEKGIVSGMDLTTFAPNARISREQMAVMLDNFATATELELDEKITEISLSDADLLSPWATSSVNRIISLGIMEGYPQGDYRPQGNATRAEAATVIYKLVGIREQ